MVNTMVMCIYDLTLLVHLPVPPHLPQSTEWQPQPQMSIHSLSPILLYITLPKYNLCSYTCAKRIKSIYINIHFYTYRYTLKYSILCVYI